MKNKILILLSLIIILSCSKNEIVNNKSVQRVSQATVYSLLLNPNDSIDEKINMIQYDWGIEARTKMSNQNDYLTILSALLADNDHTMLFDDLGINPAVTEFTGQDAIKYEPYLWLYNAESNSFNDELDPFLCIGEDIDVDLALPNFYTNDDDQTMDDEFIPGWNFATNFGSEVINETDANTMAEPLFIIVFAEKGVPLNNDPSGVSRQGNIEHPVDPESGLIRYWSESYRIDERYDRSKRSEVRFAYRLVIDSNLMGQENSIKFKIHKKYLNQWRNVIRPLAYRIPPNNVWGTIMDNETVEIYGVVYEYDWARTKKTRILQDQGGAIATIKYRAKSKDDCYEIFARKDLAYLNNGEFYRGSSIEIKQDE